MAVGMYENRGYKLALSSGRRLAALRSGRGLIPRRLQSPDLEDRDLAEAGTSGSDPVVRDLMASTFGSWWD
jgi:hypothetical protein